MKVIVAGSRNITSYRIVKAVLDDPPFEITEVVCGMARGVDLMGKRWAEENDIPVKEFPAHWDIHGKVAGVLRNQQMAFYANALIAIWDGKSRGTSNMIKYMRDKMMKPTKIWRTVVQRRD